MTTTPEPANNKTPPITWLTLEPSRKVGAAIILLSVIAAYWPSLGGGFVWDDMILVAKNPLVTGSVSLGNIWFAGDFSLTTVATWIEWLAFGKHPAGYRIVNLLLHAISSLLLWRILSRLQIRCAWLAGLLFAVHPMCVASVAWISELKNTLSLPLYLASIYFFLRFENEVTALSPNKRRALYGLSTASFTLALMAKTSTVMLPVLLLLLALWQRGRIKWNDLVRVIPHSTLALAFGLMTVWFQSNQAIRAVTVQNENLLERLLAAAMAIWFYIAKSVLPVNLCMIYPRWEISRITVTAIVPLFLLLVVIVGLWRVRHKWTWAKAVLFALIAFAVTLFPVLGFFDMYFMVFSRVSDHLAYLPLTVLIPLVAAGLGHIPRRQISVGLSALIIGSLLFLTFQRAKAFKSDEALWRDTVTKNPNAWNAHNNLACNLAEKGDIDAAMKHFALSLELNANNASAQRNYAKALVMKGRFTEAEPHFRASLEQKPNDADTLSNYAEALAANGRLTEAVERYSAALNIAPDHKTRLRLAPLLAATGQAESAIKEFRLVLKEQPDSVEALNNLAWMLATSSDATLRNGNEAVEHADKAWKLTGGKEATMLSTLGAAYAEAGQFTNAITASQQAIALAQASGNTSIVRMNQQLQQLYRAGRAYHEQPRARK